MQKTLKINCDGGARGNPGPAASAFVAHENDREIFSAGKYLGIATNNTAEYQAVLLALTWLKEKAEKYREHSIVFILDSELVTRQLTGLYKIKNDNLRELAVAIKKLESALPFKIVFKNVLRERNQVADALVNKVLDENL